MKKKKWCHFRHKVTFTLLHPIFTLIAKNKYGYKAIPYKMKKKQNYVILSNHTCSLDPFLVSLSFKNKPIYYMSSDDLLKIKFASFWMKYLASPIPKKKQQTDLNAIKFCLQIAKEGGNIGIFPEGNRSFDGELYPISISICKLIKKMNIPLILYRIDGGYGADPRWGKKARKGKVIGSVRRVLLPQEINELSEEELLTIIKENLTTPQSHNILFKSKEGAEYLERVLYVCPKCHALETLKSEKDTISCSCGFKAKYNFNLTFETNDESLKIEDVHSWYSFQKDFIKNYDYSLSKIILHDDNVTLLLAKKGEDKKPYLSGNLKLKKDRLIIENEKDKKEILFTDFEGITVQGKHRIMMYMPNGDCFTIKGEERFNAYKYVQMYYHIQNRMEEFI